jgi:probable phosphoglycerate mutase
MLGRTDVPLTSSGEALAEALAAELSPIRFARILSSPLLRARRTAEILAEGRGRPVEVDPDLAEIDLGKWDGLPFGELRARCPEAFAERERDLWGFRPPGGESFADLAGRAVPCFFRAAEGIREGEAILLVGHAGTFRVILASILGLPFPRSFLLTQDYCGMHVIGASFSPGGRRVGTFRILRLNRVPGGDPFGQAGPDRRVCGKSG